jgi:hypothetical protein
MFGWGWGGGELSLDRTLGKGVGLIVDVDPIIAFL